MPEYFRFSDINVVMRIARNSRVLLFQFVFIPSASWIGKPMWSAAVFC
jgi:hypothetical protein